MKSDSNNQPIFQQPVKGTEPSPSLLTRISQTFWGLLEHKDELYGAVFLDCLVLYTLIVDYFLITRILIPSKFASEYLDSFYLSYMVAVLKFYMVFWVMVTLANFLIKALKRQFSDHYVKLCIFFACFTLVHISRFYGGSFIFFAPIWLLSAVALCSIFMGARFGFFTVLCSVVLYMGTIILEKWGYLSSISIVSETTTYHEFFAGTAFIATTAIGCLLILLTVGPLQIHMVKLLEHRTLELEKQNLISQRLMAELEASYNKLRELDELKTAFFANISHELRTPLTMSLAPLESLITGQKGELKGEQKEYLSVMRRNMLKLLNLINNLLDFSKLEAGKMKLKVREENIGSLAKYMVGSVESWAEGRGIDISCATDKSLPTVYLDREKMEKVFLNLLSNAIKFTDKGGRIKVRVDKHDGQVAVSVSDTGIGIPEDAKEKIFDRFAQVDGSASRRYEGTGIGLALVKEFIQLHGGKVWVDSVLGEGSTFAFEIPSGRDHLDPRKVEFIDEDANVEDTTAIKAMGIMADTENKSEPEESVSQPGNGDDKPTVLVVEDNPDMRRFLKDILSTRFATQTAKDGEEGMARAMELLPALVLSDVMMPKKDGYQLCRELKSDKRTRNIPLILLTARAEMSMKLEGLEKGADDYLVKPFNAQELICRVSNLIKLRTSEQEVMKATLARFLPPKIASEMLCGSEDLLTRTRRKKLTVFFSDIRGFTALSDQMEPEETVELLNHYLREMTAIIHEYEGTLDKFMGDGIMVFFGDPLDQDDHAIRAVKMAVAMQKQMDELNKIWFEAGRKPLSIGIGINSGYCTVGGIGSERHMDYTVIGNQVNLAARLQGLAAGGDIIISHSTYSEVKHLVDVKDLDEVDIKGLHQKIKIYRVKSLLQ